MARAFVSYSVKHPVLNVFVAETCSLLSSTLTGVGRRPFIFVEAAQLELYIM